jgi:hypothetical protein
MNSLLQRSVDFTSDFYRKGTGRRENDFAANWRWAPRPGEQRAGARDLRARFQLQGILPGPKKYFLQGTSIVNISWAPETVSGGRNREEGPSRWWREAHPAAPARRARASGRLRACRPERRAHITSALERRSCMSSWKYSI